MSVYSQKNARGTGLQAAYALVVELCAVAAS
jgi:hypothetical protein